MKTDVKRYIALGLTTTLAIGASVPAAGQEMSPARAIIPPGYANIPMQIFPLTGTCVAELKPDRAAIVGGVASGGLKPSEAIDQLDKLLAAMRNQIEADGGKLLLLERVRTVKTPPPRANDKEPPFIVVQRLRAEFPAAAPVDAILQRMIELGLDRFGDNVVQNGSRREAVVRFTVGDLGAKLVEMEQRCTADAWKAWCTKPDSVCPIESPPPDLQFQSFEVQSEEKVLRPDGGATYLRFSVNRAQRAVDAPELLDNITIHLAGTISLLYYVKPAVP